MSSWKALQAELDQRYLEQGMTLKDFCRLKGINYKTGWRHLISPLSRSPEREWVASPRKAPCRAGYTASTSGSVSGAINEHRHRTSRSLSLEKARRQRAETGCELGDTLPARPVCGARAKSTGRACRNAAGYKTGHPGEGRCHLHGGIAGGAPAGNLNAMYYGLGSRVARESLIKFTPEEFMAMTAETVPCRQHVAFARADYHALHRYQQMLIRYYEARGEFEASWDVLNVLMLEMNRVLKTISKLKMRAQYHRYGEHYDVGVRVTKYLAGIGVHDEDSFVPMELLYRRTRWPDN